MEMTLELLAEIEVLKNKLERMEESLRKMRREIDDCHNGCGLMNDAFDIALKIVDKYMGEEWAN
jgi:hypothetical protein